VNFDPTVGTEIQKTRPAVVISSDAIGRLPVKVVAPLTEWRDGFAGDVWHVLVVPDAGNGLSKLSAADVLQVRGVDTQRCLSRIGRVSETVLVEIVTSLALVVEYQ